MATERIAVVDDDLEYSAVLEQSLTRHGYSVFVYESGRTFLNALESTRPPDVVLLDVLMPGLDGLDTLKRVREAVPDLPVIMLSGRQTPSTIVDCVRAGAVNYVVKGASAEAGQPTLEGAIRAALDQRTSVAGPAPQRLRLNGDADGQQPCWPESSSMRPVLAMLERVAGSDVPVLITGESGVGKEVIARELHARSPRHTRPLVKVNCAALPQELLESELFGHERGAFTGAHAPRTGKFEFADGGTLMLDEIGEMPTALQAKLLQVLQDQAVTKLGSNRTVPVDVWVIAATNRRLQQLLRSGEFRSDLYYRLQVIQIDVPPLRRRQSEILPLVEFFLRKYSSRYQRPTAPLSAELQQALIAYHWPGNVRELENVVKRFVILQDEGLLLRQLKSDSIDEGTPPPRPSSRRPIAAPLAEPPSALKDQRDAAPDDEAPSLLEVARSAAVHAERTAIVRSLAESRWNRRKAARQLGVSYKTLLNKMKGCGITDANAGDESSSSPA